MSLDRTIVFKTERLAVRLMTEQDVDLIHDLWTDPRVMTYVGFPKGLRITREQILERHLNTKKDAFEQLLIIELEKSGQAIGHCKMARPNEESVVDPDVKLLPAFWGHKYGAEVWQAMVDYVFTHTDCQIVYGSPNVENVASIKMMEATGAVRVDESVYEFPEAMKAFTTTVHCYIYHLARADWERRKAGQHSP
ncbi:MAG: GNAT family N-acetyltransferase [Anaerolineae bacterium]|nr:GNAT family N-acetyltransferase [Anaerolineae bacterium]